jgi:hypothetical protein
MDGSKSNRRDKVLRAAVRCPGEAKRFDFDPSIRAAEQRLDFVPAEKSWKRKRV